MQFLRYRRSLAAGGALAAGVTALSLFFGTRSPAALPALPASGGGVTLSRISRVGVGRGAAVEASEGDWLLESDSVRLVLGADAPSAERQLRFGSIIDATVQNFSDDSLTDLKPRLEVAGAELPLRTESIRPVLEGTRPALRLLQSSRDGRLSLTTDISIRPGRPVIDLLTRVENVSEQKVSGLSLGDRSRWLGAPTFAPRLGYVKYAGHAKAPWVGREGREVSYALAFLDGPAEVTFRFDRVGSIGQTSMWGPFELAPGAVRTYWRGLIVGKGGLHRAAAEAWQSLGTPVGHVRGLLRPAPAWATVDALDASGRPALSVTVAPDGRYDLALPTGKYRLLLRAPGGEQEQPVEIRAGQSVAGALVPPEPARLLLEVLDSHQTPLPSRWMIRGLAPTKDPEFGPSERATGAKNMVFAKAGRAEVSLPAGRYRIVATHGPEYSIYDQELSIGAHERATVHAELSRVIDTAGYVACDFHVHAAPSHDSSVSLEDRVLALVAEGVEFAVATDHNHVTDYGPIIERQHLSGVLASARGVEMTTKTWGHFNAFPFPQGAPAPKVELVDPPELFSSVRKAAPGAIIQVNHPRMRGVGYFNRIELDRDTGAAATEGFSFEFDTIEVANGFELADAKAIEANIQEWFSLLNSGHHYAAVGNSDSHRLVYQWPGYPRTYVRVKDDDPDHVTPAEIAEALREGRASVSSGPFVTARLDETAEPGDRISVRNKRAKLSVKALAPDWIDVRRAEVYVNGERVAVGLANPTKDAVRIDWRTELKFNQDSWVVVVVRGEKLLDTVLSGTRAAPLAFTNPIFVDADGDGKLRFTARPHRAPAPSPRASAAAH